MVLSVTTEKSPVTPPGIDPETIRLVAQCLNHYATPGPRWEYIRRRNTNVITEIPPNISIKIQKSVIICPVVSLSYDRLQEMLKSIPFATIIFHSLTQKQTAFNNQYGYRDDH